MTTEAEQLAAQRVRLDQAKVKHLKALQALRLKEAEVSAKERERQRKSDTRMKAVLGSALLAAIRNGHLSWHLIREGIEPVLREQDRRVLSPLTDPQEGLPE